jgi:hypothetical protein
MSVGSCLDDETGAFDSLPVGGAEGAHQHPASTIPPAATNRRAVRIAKTLFHVVALLLVACAAAEVVTRVDDWIRNDVPLLASPEREHDLTVAEPWGFRGRPHGCFRKWKLNEFGFRGPEITERPAAGCTRIMVLGASETFGYFESPGKEYPAQLADLMREWKPVPGGAAATPTNDDAARRLFPIFRNGPVEVVNTSLAGMTLTSMVAYFDHWVARFGPQIVVIYPSPLFYLDDGPPAALREGEAPAEPPQMAPTFRPRVWNRVYDLLQSLPPWVKAFRDDWAIRKRTAGKSADWFFAAPPQDRIELFTADLAALVRHVRAQGAEPVLVTHAHSASSPPGPADQARLRTMRMFFPRATPETMVAFEDQANRAILDLARRENVAVIDAASVLNGHREWFADLVHFNDQGAAVMARTLADGLAGSGR